MHNDDNLNREIEAGLARTEKMLRNERYKRILYILVGICALVGTFFLGMLISRPSGGLVAGLYFSSNRSGKYEIYYLGPDSKTRQITRTASGESWGPALSPTGAIYFVSNRDGKSEIYSLVSGKAQKVTNSPDNSNSWGVMPTIGGIYFVSDRSGVAEIYFLGVTSNGKSMRVTDSNGNFDSRFSIGE